MGLNALLRQFPAMAGKTRRLFKPIAHFRFKRKSFECHKYLILEKKGFLVDLWILLSAISSYCFFLILYFTTFRLAKPEEVFYSLMRSGGVTAAWHLGSLYWMYQTLRGSSLSGGHSNSTGMIVFGAGVSFFILGLLLFIHVLCLFGPYETSIRLRLIRELFRGPSEGMSRAEILKNYNGRIILEKRLTRLTASGELAVDPVTQTYQIEKHVNVFFLIDTIVRFLQRAIAKQKG